MVLAWASGSPCFRNFMGLPEPMILLVEQSGILDAFWNRHSV